MAGTRGPVSGAAIPLWLSPPAAPSLPRGTVHLWRFPLDSSPSELSVLKGYLSADELLRAERLLNRRKAQHFVVGRGRLRQILGSYLHFDPAALDFIYND